MNIDRTPGTTGMAQEVSHITVKADTHKKTPNLQNLVSRQKNLGFPILTKPPVQEYLSIPFPDFCTLFYEITIWSQYQSQMNSILEKIFYNYDHKPTSSFVMWSEYDKKNKKGNGYRFVGYKDGDVASQSNVEDFSDEERIIRYSYNIKVPAYLILDPKDETLAYGKNKGNSQADDGSKIVYKMQNNVDIKLTEKVLTAKDLEKLFKG